MELSKQRIQRWDNIKAVLIFLVVLGHVADIYADVSFATGVIRFIIYSFHMPLFLFISGMFSKKNVQQKRWDKIFSYLVLYIFLKILIFIAKWISYGKQPQFNLFSEMETPWYVFCLFAFCIITIALKNVKWYYVLTVSIIVACISGYDNSIRDFLCLSRIIVFYPFFYAGFLIEPEKLNSWLKNKKIIIISLLFLIGVIITVTVFYSNIKGIKYIYTGRNPYSVIVKNAPYAFLFRIICYVTSAAIGLSFMAIIPDKMKNNLISVTGSRSVQIYALHKPLMILWFGIVNERFQIEQLFVSKLVLYEIVISVLIYVICALPVWNPLFRRILTVPVSDNK